MIICSCTGATDREIRQLALRTPEGASLSQCALAAGQCCGGCATKVQEIITLAQRQGAKVIRAEAARE